MEPTENPFSHFSWQAQLVLGRDAGEDSKTSERTVQVVIPRGGGIVQWLETEALEQISWVQIFLCHMLVRLDFGKLHKMRKI